MATIEDRLKCIEANQQQQNETLVEIKMAICGSEKIGFEGIVEKVKRHENYIEADKKQKWLVAGGISVFTFILGTLFQVWDKIFK
jgi:hypothetical protein